MQSQTRSTAATRIPLVILASCLAFLVGGGASAQCRAPRFREGRDFISPEVGRGALYVSIRPSDFTLNKLVCLTQALRQHNPNWKNVNILIFSTYDAAKYFQPSHADYEGRVDWAKWAKQLHAAYFFDAAKREEYLEITPLGYGGNASYDTRIDLPLAATPHCRFEINDRCLLELDEIVYPDAALKANVSGTVTLTGSISSSGKMLDLKVAELRVDPVDRKDVLVNEALRNLGTWRLERARHQDAFRIEFAYVIDRSLPHRGEVDVKLALPNQVTIRGNPAE